MKTIPEEAYELLQSRIPASLFNRVRVLAASRGKGYSPRDVVIEALEQYLPEAEQQIKAAHINDRQPVRT